MFFGCFKILQESRRLAPIGRRRRTSTKTFSLLVSVSELPTKSSNSSFNSELFSLRHQFLVIFFRMIALTELCLHVSTTQAHTKWRSILCSRSTPRRPRRLVPIATHSHLVSWADISSLISDTITLQSPNMQVQVPALNHIGLWVDNLAAAVLCCTT